MADNFEDYNQGLDSPAFNAVEITPADSDLSTDLRGFYVGVTGNVTVMTSGGNTVLFVAVPAGSIMPIRCKQVRATGTTATSIVGLY
jgi:hypothetical protein